MAEQNSQLPIFTSSKILFKVLTKKPTNFFTLGKFRPIQFHTFQFGLNLKNISTTVSPGGRLYNIKLRSVEGNEVIYPISKELTLPELDPSQSVVIWIESINTPLSGTVWLEGEIKCDDPAQQIETYQYDLGCDSYNKYMHSPRWGDTFFIRTENEHEQRRTNTLIFILTILTFIDAVFGLKWICSVLTNLIGTGFVSLGELFRFIGNSIK